MDEGDLLQLGQVGSIDGLFKTGRERHSLMIPHP